MANPEHVEIVKQGAEAIRAWREKNPDVWLSLGEANLGRVNLSGVNLRKANLSEANLRGADLRGADLCGVNLSEANLSEANLSKANLSKANLRKANLRGANLNWANVNWADLLGADLRRAGLRGMDLIGANLSEAKLSGTDLEESVIGSTVLGNLDLSRVSGLEGIHHFGPSTIGVDSEINRAFEKEQEIMKERGHKVLSLIPLNLDDYLFKWTSGKATEVKTRLAADFTGWETDDEKFKTELERLIKALRAGEGGREPPPPQRL